jgi:nitrite reductase/ring-hydroxylating ferredoxin subunit
MIDNPARPKPGAIIARLSDLPAEGAIAVDFAQGEAQFSLIVAVSGGVVRGFENVCPHAGFPLERPDGRVPMQEGRYLICSAHGASFDVQTGVCVAGPGSGRETGRGLRPVPLRVENDRVLVA